MSTDNLPPLPDSLHKSLRVFATACSFGDDVKVRISAADAIQSEVRAYAAQAVAAERERCALICESNADNCDPKSLMALVLRANANAIRDNANP